LSFRDGKNKKRAGERACHSHLGEEAMSSIDKDFLGRPTPDAKEDCTQGIASGWHEKITRHERTENVFGPPGVLAANAYSGRAGYDAPNATEA
jgi:hypothetical protein